MIKIHKFGWFIITVTFLRFIKEYCEGNESRFFFFSFF